MKRKRERERDVRIRLLDLALGHAPPLPSVHQICKDLIYLQADLIYLQALQSHIATAPEEAVTICGCKLLYEKITNAYIVIRCYLANHLIFISHLMLKRIAIHESHLLNMN